MINIDLIIVAAGNSLRFGSNKMNALFLKNKTVLEATIEKFYNLKVFNKIIIVNNTLESINKYPSVIFVKGGETRQNSVLEGLKKATAQYVAIHDGARPYIKTELILDLIDKIKNNDAVVCGKYPINAIKLVDNNIIIKGLKKKTIALVQTPQIFNTKKILKAHNNGIKNNINDDEDDIETYTRLFSNEKIFVLFHNTDNHKITFIDDILKL